MGARPGDVVSRCALIALHGGRLHMASERKNEVGRRSFSRRLRTMHVTDMVGRGTIEVSNCSGGRLDVLIEEAQRLGVEIGRLLSPHPSPRSQRIGVPHVACSGGA